LPSAADVLAAASNHGWSHIDLPRRDFFGRGGDQQWTNSLNWVGNQVPGGRDDAYLRNGGTVRLAAELTEIQRVADLFVEGGTELVIDGVAQLKVKADPYVWDSHGKVLVRDQGMIKVAGTRVAALEAQDVELKHGGELSLAGGTIWIHGDLAVDFCDPIAACGAASGPASSITGYGQVNAGSRLVNHGRIAGVAHPTIASRRTLTFVANQSSGTVWNVSAKSSTQGAAIGQVLASQGDVRFRGGDTAISEGQMLAENGYSIQFDTSPLINSGELAVRDVTSFIFAPRIENSGAIELDSGGSLRAGQFHNAGGTIRGDGRIIFSDAFTNEAGLIHAADGQTLAFAASGRNVHWDLAGNSPESHWKAINRGRIRLGAAAADDVHFETLSGSFLVENGGAIEFDFHNQFEFSVGRSGRIEIVGTNSVLLAPNAALMIGVESETFGGKRAMAGIDQGRLEVGALYIGGDDKGGITDADLKLDHGIVTASNGLRIWPTGLVDGVGTINADVVNDGTLRLGASASAFQINGSFSQGPAGILTMEVGNAQMHTPLEINGDAALDGILELTFNERPSIGAAINLMDYWSVAGGFRKIVLPPNVQAKFVAATGELFITAVTPEPSAMRLLLLFFGSVAGIRRGSRVRARQRFASALSVSRNSPFPVCLYNQVTIVTPAELNG
jgi:hypothetical protein